MNIIKAKEAFKNVNVKPCPFCGEMELRIT